MLPSPNWQEFGLWGDSFSGLLCVYWSLRPDDLLTILKMALSIARDSVSLFPAIPATRFLTFTSVGLAPTEHISLLLFPGCAGPGYPPRLAPVHASLSPSRYQRKTRGRADRQSLLV